ncbi:helix-turn-helix domain-containing protein [Lentzea nigeriaca]|uniref:helix-turn-helix domain-containing protein n=1 Tax=Lentzea nigeriaca TaxID=1128665 RepID=UPI0019581C17|nr:helix-turn-helix transcriptional regulator [Lentzea nigeriaca]MBM7856599.1 transcriptional regulator with XRE-family HTH domain [Lentzea nigeriaca]
MDSLGPALRALRQASGRTVASVAADAGLSVPYIANLENGRGNPTTGALARLASALGTELRISFGDGEEKPVPVPASLVRVRRTERFRRVVAEIGADPADVVAALAAVGAVVEAGEQDWWRMLDAMVLIARHPA